MSAQQPSNALKREIEIYDSLEELSEAAAERFVTASEVAIQARGRFTVVLSGGSTPRSLYSLLAAEPFSSRIDWQKVHFFWGDERSVPPIHKDSNFRMVRETLLSKVNAPLTNVHRIPGEKTVASEAAKVYAGDLKSFFSLREGEWPRFDLVLLGMGPDGHTASLFPDTLVLHEATALVASPWVDKLKCYRITLTPPALNHAAQIVFFVAGSDKAPSLHEVLEGSFRPETYPAQLIRPLDGKVTWMVDREAAAQLRTRE
jgi:6-phosphogluconolactonase